ncbi:GNAT family N-acetyltransferase [Candidatus Bathyarchaeota archaeon]|nr:GNAT family N-acetyltransferase [Candidatus Bathyarchaeota archaeon]
MSGDQQKFTLREATLDDVQILVRQRRLMWVEVANARDEKALDAMDEAYRRYIEKMMPSGMFKAWVIEDENGRVVAGGGLAVYEQPPRPQDDTLRYVYVHSIYTEPEYRRRGFARKILNRIVQYCRENGFKTLTLHAVEASRPLYESFGFKPTTEMRMFL